MGTQTLVKHITEQRLSCSTHTLSKFRSLTAFLRSEKFFVREFLQDEQRRCRAHTTASDGKRGRETGFSIWCSSKKFDDLMSCITEKFGFGKEGDGGGEHGERRKIDTCVLRGHMLLD